MDNTLIFVRASTKEQETENQLSSGTKYARDRGLKVHKTIVLKQSGYKTDYDSKLNLIFRQILRTPVTNVVIWSADRLSRNLVAFCKLIDQIRLRRPHLVFHFILEGKMIAACDFFPATTEACEIFEFINAGQTASAVLSRKIKASRYNARQANANAYLGGVVPLGKKVETLDGRRVILTDEEQHDLAHLIVHLRPETNFDDPAPVVDDYDCSDILNSKSIYCPFFVRGKKEYRLWTKQDCEKFMKLENEGYIPEPYVVFFGDNDMETDEDDEEINSVLDTMVYRKEKYSKVLWKSPKANEEPNICWVKTDTITKTRID